jgi:hypothetical protein
LEEAFKILSESAPIVSNLKPGPSSPKVFTPKTLHTVMKRHKDSKFTFTTGVKNHPKIVNQSKNKVIDPIPYRIVTSHNRHAQFNTNTSVNEAEPAYMSSQTTIAAMPEDSLSIYPSVSVTQIPDDNVSAINDQSSPSHDRTIFDIDSCDDQFLSDSYLNENVEYEVDGVNSDHVLQFNEDRDDVSDCETIGECVGTCMSTIFEQADHNELDESRDSTFEYRHIMNTIHREDIATDIHDPEYDHSSVDCIIKDPMTGIIESDYNCHCELNNEAVNSDGDDSIPVHDIPRDSDTMDQALDMNENLINFKGTSNFEGVELIGPSEATDVLVISLNDLDRDMDMDRCSISESLDESVYIESVTPEARIVYEDSILVNNGDIMLDSNRSGKSHTIDNLALTPTSQTPSFPLISQKTSPRSTGVILTADVNVPSLEIESNGSLADNTETNIRESIETSLPSPTLTDNQSQTSVTSHIVTPDEVCSVSRLNDTNTNSIDVPNIGAIETPVYPIPVPNSSHEGGEHITHTFNHLGINMYLPVSLTNIYKRRTSRQSSIYDSDQSNANSNNASDKSTRSRRRSSVDITAMHMAAAIHQRINDCDTSNDYNSDRRPGYRNGGSRRTSVTSIGGLNFIEPSMSRNTSHNSDESSTTYDELPLNSYIPIKEIDEVFISTKQNSFVGNYVRSNSTLAVNKSDDQEFNTCTIDDQPTLTTSFTDFIDSYNNRINTSEVLTSRSANISSEYLINEVTPVIHVVHANHIIDASLTEDDQLIRDTEKMELIYDKNAVCDILMDKESSVEPKSSVSLFDAYSTEIKDPVLYKNISGSDVLGACTSDISVPLSSSASGSGYNIVKARRKASQSEVIEDI